MQTQEINRIVQDLLQRGYEGTYWDYKEDYTDCKEDKLIDIICMANNIDGRDAYLIYGATVKSSIGTPSVDAKSFIRSSFGVRTSLSY